MATWTLKKVIEIDAAHRLPKHPGKCQEMHGHRWRFVIEIDSVKLNDQGMVVDFGLLKEVVGRLDHKVLNEIPPFDEVPPTAENLARQVAIDVGMLEGLQWNDIRVTVAETPGSEVTYATKCWEVCPPKEADPEEMERMQSEFAASQKRGGGGGGKGRRRR
jgi:6-pyruvoyltetrahydropterin/6-carboxytetrahydropterin synthase